MSLSLESASKLRSLHHGLDQYGIEVIYFATLIQIQGTMTWISFNKKFHHCCYIFARLGWAWKLLMVLFTSPPYSKPLTFLFSSGSRILILWCWHDQTHWNLICCVRNSVYVWLVGRGQKGSNTQDSSHSNTAKNFMTQNVNSGRLRNADLQASLPHLFCPHTGSSYNREDVNQKH